MSNMMDTQQTASGGPSRNASDSKRQGLISVNNLNYIMEPDLSVASNCTYKNHFFQQDKYLPQQRGICIFNSGADYIDTRRSFLRFKVTVGVANSNLLLGSAINFINNITVSSRSGDELARIRKANLWSATVHPYEYSDDFRKANGSAFGWDEGDIKFAAGDNTRVFCIPLYLLCDFFNVGKLHPSMLMSGLRIEIQFEKASVALNGDGTQTYDIQELFISAKSVQLTDATQRALNEVSAVNGLEVVYCDWENTEQQLESSTFHIEVRKASSRALKAFVKIRQISTDSSKEVAQDLLASAPWNAIKYQWQLGSLYFPQQPVGGRSTDPKETITEAYTHLLDAHDKLQPSSTPPSVPIGGQGSASSGISPSFQVDSGCIGVTLERSTLFNYAGVPINNSRVLALRLELAPPAASTQHNVNIFLKYVKLARVFLNNVEVEQ